ncbi:MAG: hypothetical protein KGI04_02575 [Candidatus Micrarchaeota archaeon]|nr:hypothetical protein [Candidatus Micrarchaeota archaeon]
MTKRRKLSPNYARYRDYYLNYERKHWAEYYRTHAGQIKKQRHEHYLANRTAILQKDHEYSITHKEQRSVYNKQYRARNLTRLREHDRNYYSGNIERIRRYRKENSARFALQRKEYKSRLREEVFRYYSEGSAPRCAGCGETRISLLTLDHIHNDGASERRKLKRKGGIEFYIWLKKNSFPAGYQVLCYNCNWIRRYNSSDTVRSRYSRNIKVDLLSHYAKRNGEISCAICGENRMEVLTIDHINGGGHREQQRVGMKGTEYYRFLAKSGYPLGFRVLCMNCNVSSARRNDGVIAVSTVY